MSKILTLIVFLAVLFYGCDSEAPACTTLSWGETKIEETGFDLKYSAGNQCENINDYYDIDIESIILKIQKMKFVKNSDCTQDNYETGEEEVIECPEFIPETIEFDEVVKCKFDTPPSDNTDCAVNPLQIYFSTDSVFERFSWSFDLDKPEELAEFSGSYEDNVIESFSFSLSSKKVYMTATWTESNGTDEVKKETGLGYSIEIKE